ncbi:MAG: ferritin-like domain-containing protein [Deltaproteobacteria bacterium]|nr:ferritin-like domain-containing protein [Deltaproteobacteria bacterium]
MKASSLSKVLFAIAAAAPASLAVTACGGAVAGEDLGSSGGVSSGSSGASSGASSGSSGAGDKGSSGTSSGSSGASSGSSGASSGASSGTSGCSPVPPRTFKATYAGVLCTSDADAGPDEPPCESEEIACRRVCESSLGFNEHFGACSFEADKKTIVCETMGMPCGRAHEGLAPLAANDTCDRSPIARWLEEAAYLEDASVTSFEILARELAAHGAPAHLVRAAKKSARDEVRHARTMSALAQRHGGRATRSDTGARKRATRSLEAMLLENAVEGCIHETYGALLAWYQAANASDPKLRAAMRVIARDESEHAVLAWQIATWAERKLDDAARTRIEAARALALAELHTKIGVEPTPWIAETLGLPSAEVALGMLRSLARELPQAA